MDTISCAEHRVTFGFKLKLCAQHPTFAPPSVLVKALCNEGKALVQIASLVNDVLPQSDFPLMIFGDNLDQQLALAQIVRIKGASRIACALGNAVYGRCADAARREFSTRRTPKPFTGERLNFATPDTSQSHPLKIRMCILIH